MIIRITDGLGNQLFQYAASRAWAIRNQGKVLYGIDYYLSNNARKDRPFYLPEILGVNIPVAKRNSIEDIVARGVTICAASKPLQIGNMIYISKSIGYDERFLNLGKVSVASGYFQSEKYFKFANTIIKGEILNGLSQKLSIAKSYLQDRYKRETVAVHIRRGDYAEGNVASNKLVPLGRIRAAIEAMGRDYHYVVFSDDRSCIDLDLGVPFDFLTGDDLQEFTLMASCDHYIIANSTFSWWASYLGANPSKVVFAPKNWTSPGSVDDLPDDDIYLDSHIRY